MRPKRVTQKVEALLSGLLDAGLRLIAARGNSQSWAEDDPDSRFWGSPDLQPGSSVAL